MSRYQWPPPPRSRDRVHERMQWNALTDGILLADAVSAARPLGAPVARGAPQPGLPLWVPIGPSTVIRGQAAAEPRVSGRVRDVAVSPDGRRVYAATANAGVWYSADEGTTWSPIGGWGATPELPPLIRGAHALACGCLLVTFGDAVDGSEDIVYVGTGEIRTSMQPTHSGQPAGVGVLRLMSPLPAALADPFGNHWRREARNLTGRGIFRLARRPGSGPETLVAATSGGLFFRTGAFVPDAEWTRAPHPPFDHDFEDQKWTTDVLWTENPGRLWVAFLDDTWFSDTGVYVSNGGPTAPFHEVALKDVVKNGRLGLAEAARVQPSDPTRIYVLGTGPRLWRIEGLEATRIGGVPSKLFGAGSGQDQSRYDLAVTGHPDDPDVVVIGGAAAETDKGSDAAMFRCRVTGSGGNLALDFAAANQDRPSRDPTFVGDFVHADVHQIRYVKVPTSPNPLRLWVCCDGGVYYSRAGGDLGTFTARNDGLAALECGYVASHPTSPAPVVAGTQDNGMLERVGDTVWRVALSGDGGGAAYNPRDGRHFIGQQHNSSWQSNGGTFPAPVERSNLAERDYKAERDSSFFYSGVAARHVTGLDRVRLALGTNRVWLMENWRPDRDADPATQTNTWVTLPSGLDPRKNDPDDSGTDVLKKGGVLACRWVTDTRLLALFGWSVVLYTKAAAGPRWDHAFLTPGPPSHCGDLENSDLPEGPTSSFLPPLGTWTDIAPHQATRPAHGSCYVAATGHATIDDNTVEPADRMDTLWWFDGDSTWHKTGLRNDATPQSRGTTAPAFAVLCDPPESPGDPDLVYVGTALGVWRGRLTFTGGTPDWRWEPFSNGLPEAPVHDLSMFRNGGLKLLRAAIQARGVWEVDLSASPTPTARTYLRVHPADVRRVLPTDLTNPFLHGAGYVWHRSPDIMVRPLDLPTAPPAVPAFPWTRNNHFTYDLWQFQMALHGRDPIVVPDGRWTAQFSARLIADNPAVGDQITAQRWRDTVDQFTAFRDPWDGIEPTEADLMERVVEETMSSGEGNVREEYVRGFRIRYRVDVLVHRRDLRPLPPADVRVVLLLCQLPDPDGPVSHAAFAITDAWKAAAAAFVRGEGPATAIPAPWQVADPAFPVQHPRQPVDARLPRAVTFDVDLRSLPAPNTPSVLLLALVHAVGDELTVGQMTGATVRELVLSCHRVAAKILNF